MSCDNQCAIPKEALKNNGASDIVLIAQPFDLSHAEEDLGGFDQPNELQPSNCIEPLQAVRSKKNALRYRHEKYRNTGVFKAALEEFARDCEHPGIMPSRFEMVNAHQWELLREVYWRGGWEIVIHDTGLQKPTHPLDYTKDQDALKADLLEFVATYGDHQTMPSRDLLKAHGKNRLANAIIKIGESRVAWFCGLIPLGRYPTGHWDDFSNLDHELREFICEHGVEGRAPKLSELERYGKKYLLRPIRNFGGIVEVAKKMDLEGAWKHHNREAEE